MNSPQSAIICSPKSRWMDGTLRNNGNMSHGFFFLLFLAALSYSFRANTVPHKNIISAGAVP